MNKFFISFFLFHTHIWTSHNRRIKFQTNRFVSLAAYGFISAVSCVFFSLVFVSLFDRRIWICLSNPKRNTHTHRNTNKSLNNVLIELLEILVANSLLNLTSVESRKSIPNTCMAQTGPIIGISKLWWTDMQTFGQFSEHQ